MRKVVFLIILIITFCLTFGLNEFKANVKEQPQWMVESFEGIKKQIAKYAMPGGIVGIAIKDLDTGETFSMNGSQLFNPASVIKIPVMVEAFHQVEQGKISLNDKLTLCQRNKLVGSGSLQFFKNGSVFSIKKLIELMITDSDNTATNMLIEKLGMYNINSFMRYNGIYRTVLKDPTMFNKKEGQYNITCPEDMLKIMDKIYRGKLVSNEASMAMLEIMKAQRHKWGIARFLPNVIIANKTGSLDFVRNDVGIILDKDKPYIISIFSKQLPSNYSGSVMVGALSKIIYDVRKHQLIGKSSVVSRT